MSTVKRQLLSGFFYTALSRYAGIIISLVIMGILSRILTPKDFGLVAVASVFIGFFQIIGEMGLGPAVVQNKTLDDRDVQHIFTFSIYVSLSMALVFFLCAGFIAAFYDEAENVTIFRLLSLNLFFASMNIVPNATLAKQKLFRFIAFRTVTIQLIVGVFAIIGALNGLGVYALLINPIVGSLIILLTNLYRSSLRPALTFSKASVQKVIGFSSYQFLFNIINYFSRNSDNLLIGKAMGMSALAYYDKSYRLMIIPLSNITHVISPVIQPVFSEFQHDKQLIANYYLKIVRLLALIGLPLSVFLFFASREIVLLMFGPQWEASVDVFRILSISVGFQVILSSSGSVFQAANSAKYLFISGLIAAVVTVSGIVIGTFVLKTLEAVAVCIVIAYTINFIQVFSFLFRVSLAMDMRVFFNALKAPLLIYVPAMTAALYVTSRFTTDLPIFYSFTIKSFVAAIVYLSLAFLLKDLNYMVRVLRPAKAPKTVLTT